LLTAARDAFTTAVHTAAGLTAFVLAGTAVLLAVTLRSLPVPAPAAGQDTAEHAAEHDRAAIG
jgi:hypothetical protein